MFEKNKNLIMIFDAMYFAYRSYYAHLELTLEDKKTNVGLIYGFIDSIRYYNKKYKPSKIIICWDGKENLRKKIYPDYKKGRQKDAKFDEKSFFQQVDITKKILRDLGIVQIWAEGYESDDIMPEFCRKVMVKSPNLKFYIVTKDHDLYQCITENVNILAPGENDTLYTPESFFRFKGVTPSQYFQSMIISGCKTDNIPGIDKIGEGKAIAIMKEIGHLKNLKDATKIPGIGDEKLKEIKGSMDKMKFTKSLVSLYRDFDFKIDKGNRDLDLVKGYFNEYLKFYGFIFDWDSFREIN